MFGQVTKCIKTVSFSGLVLLCSTFPPTLWAEVFVCDSPDAEQKAVAVFSTVARDDIVVATHRCESITINCSSLGQCRGMSVFADAEHIEINCTAPVACRNARISIATGSGTMPYPEGFDLGDFDEQVSSFALNCGTAGSEWDTWGACLGIQVDSFEAVTSQSINCAQAIFACNDADLKLYTSSPAGSGGISIDCGKSNSAFFRRCDFQTLEVESAGAEFLCTGADCQYAPCDSLLCEDPSAPPELADADGDGVSDHYDVDDDNDGVPDDLDESPFDSDLPLLDGGRDDDDDGLSNALELVNGTNPNAVESSTKDEAVSISPKFHIFGGEPAYASDCHSTSSPVTYTVTNDSSSALTITAIGIQSASTTDAQGFEVVATTDGCSETSLPAGEHCQFAVLYCPRVQVDEQGASVGAILQVRTDSVVTPLLESALASHEGQYEEPQRRLPPVVSELRLLDDASDMPVDGAMLLEQTSYTLDFVVSGYHDSYSVIAVLFDCSSVPIASCGLSFAQMIDNSGFMAPQTAGPGDWTHGTIQDKNFGYRYSFTTPAVGGTTHLVVRFYQKSNKDSFAGQNSLSLMLPGNLPIDYVDSSGRRALLSVQRKE